MFDIIASVAARGDLEEIKTYLLTEFRNPQAVVNLEAAIRQAYDTLAESQAARRRFRERISLAYKQNKRVRFYFVEVGAENGEAVRTPLLH